MHCIRLTMQRDSGGHNRIKATEFTKSLPPTWTDAITSLWLGSGARVGETSTLRCHRCCSLPAAGRSRLPTPMLQGHAPATRPTWRWNGSDRRAPSGSCVSHVLQSASPVRRGFTTSLEKICEHTTRFRALCGRHLHHICPVRRLLHGPCRPGHMESCVRWARAPPTARPSSALERPVRHVLCVIASAWAECPVCCCGGANAGRRTASPRSRPSAASLGTPRGRCGAAPQTPEACGPRTPHLRCRKG
mmetsp:Transcript_11957/g.18323  ORF Transcript_11957/g.18323 Transcript_11957/m.18323 type:complete len:247 (-) Transcript_11957:193-933(-)